MNVEQARWAGKHLPPSHPVVRRLERPAPEAVSLPGSTAVMQEATERLEAIAIAVRQLPDRKLSVLQLRMVDVIVAELLRRRHA